MPSPWCVKFAKGLWLVGRSKQPKMSMKKREWYTAERRMKPTKKKSSEAEEAPHAVTHISASLPRPGEVRYQYNGTGT